MLVQSANPWHWIIDEPRLSGAEKMVALVILRHQNSKKKAWPAAKTIARLAGFSERHTQRIMRSLERKAALHIEKRSGQSSLLSIQQSQFLLFRPPATKPKPDSNLKHTPDIQGGGLYVTPDTQGGGKKVKEPPNNNLATPDIHDSNPPPPCHPKSVYKTVKKDPHKNRGGHPLFQPILDYAFQAYEERHHHKPSWTPKDDFRALRDLLRASPQLSLEEFQTVFQNYLDSTVPFYQQKGWRLKYACTDFDGLRSGAKHPRGGKTDAKTRTARNVAAARKFLSDDRPLDGDIRGSLRPGSKP